MRIGVDVGGTRSKASMDERSRLVVRERVTPQDDYRATLERSR